MPRQRVVRFAVVGMGGFVVQAAALAALVHAHVPILAATVVAVEGAVLHNFWWHERWTWRDHPAHGLARVRRLLAFHGLAGVVSVTGNVAAVWLLSGLLRWPPLLSTLTAVIALSLVNYLASGALVFKGEPPAFEPVLERIRRS